MTSFDNVTITVIISYRPITAEENKAHRNTEQQERGLLTHSHTQKRPTNHNTVWIHLGGFIRRFTAFLLVFTFENIQLRLYMTELQ